MSGHGGFHIWSKGDQEVNAEHQIGVLHSRRKISSTISDFRTEPASRHRNLSLGQTRFTTAMQSSSI